MIVYKKIIVPEDKRLFFVGDIHGAFDLYQKGCKDLGITDEDVVISLGDLIDRGPKNFKSAMEFISKENRYAIMGNHEDMMVKGLLEGCRQNYECWMFNGGAETWEELGGEEASIALASLLKDLPIILEVEYKGKTVGCIHGGIPEHYFKGMDWEEITIKSVANKRMPHQLIWDRSVIDIAKTQLQQGSNPEEHIGRIEGVDYVLHGHTPVKEPFIIHNRIYIDTGGFFNSRLTFAYLEEDGLKFYTTGDWDEL